MFWSKLQNRQKCGDFTCFCSCGVDALRELILMGKDLSLEELNYMLDIMCSDPCAGQSPGPTDPGIGTTGGTDPFVACAAALKQSICTPERVSAMEVYVAVNEQVLATMEPGLARDILVILLNLVRALLSMCSADGSSLYERAQTVCINYQKYAAMESLISSQAGDAPLVVQGALATVRQWIAGKIAQLMAKCCNIVSPPAPGQPSPTPLPPVPTGAERDRPDVNQPAGRGQAVRPASYTITPFTPGPRAEYSQRALAQGALTAASLRMMRFR
jgi:hypothetical protein